MQTRKQIKSLMGGAALAALLILPTVHAEAKHTAPPAPPAAPAAPSQAAPAQAAPSAPAAPANGNWVRVPVKSYDATSLKVEDMVGTLTVDVKDSGPMTVEISGDRNRVNRLKVRSEGGLLHIDSENSDDSETVWDWKNWFNFADGSPRRTTNLFVRVSVPRGTEVNVSDLVGNATIGDTNGTLKFNAAASTAHIGRVKDAKIDIDGSGKIFVTEVSGPFNLYVGGSGKITVGATDSVKAKIEGSGDVTLGPIAHGMNLTIEGSGDVSAAKVNGPVDVDIEGAGSVKIADGVADPLHLQFAGAGNFSFGGLAVNPHIEAAGSGSVKIKAMKGTLDNEGMANVQIGQQ